MPTCIGGEDPKAVVPESTGQHEPGVYRGDELTTPRCCLLREVVAQMTPGGGGTGGGVARGGGAGGLLWGR